MCNYKTLTFLLAGIFKNKRHLSRYGRIDDERNLDKSLNFLDGGKQTCNIISIHRAIETIMDDAQVAISPNMCRIFHSDTGH